MLRGLKRALPIVAIVGAITVVVTIPVAWHQRQAALTDTGETRSVVESWLAELLAMHPASIDDIEFRRALEQATAAPYAAAVWLFAPDGRIIYSAGSTAPSTASYGTVEGAATNDTRRALDALHTGALSHRQRMWLLAVSAMRREGEHNDLYRHLLRPVETLDGSTVALIGVAYDVSEWVPAIGWKLALLLGVVGLGVYWLSLPLWVLLDARSRNERAWAWTAFVFMGNLMALIAYLLSRFPTKKSSPAD